jgi:TonB family protein
MPSWESHAKPAKKSPMIPIAAAAVLVIAAAAAFFYLRGRTPAGSTSAASKATAPRTQTTAGAVPPATTESIAATVAPSTQAPILDAAKVDEEVKKRLAAERNRLEQQARTREAPPQGQPAAIAQRPAPQPVAQPAVPSPVPQPVPPPVTQTAVAESRPPAPAPQPVTQTVAPAAAAQPAAESPKTRQGELVASGSEDVPARMLRRANVPYPPVAKMQRVEGTVLVNALISEDGRVLDAKVVRPINRPVGLNEAAEQIIRRSTYSPPMKDGVKVRVWTTFPVDFKL